MNKTVAQTHVHVCFAFTNCIHEVHTSLCAVCLPVSVHKGFLHVASNVYLMWPGPVVVWALLPLIAVNALGWSPFKGFIPPADPEDLFRFRLSVRPSQQPRCGSFYSALHVLFITCCHELSKAAMTNAAFLFMNLTCWPHISNHHYPPQLTASAVKKS